MHAGGVLNMLTHLGLKDCTIVAGSKRLNFESYLGTRTLQHYEGSSDVKGVQKGGLEVLKAFICVLHVLRGVTR